jgi:hypothetical protein
MQSSWQQIDAWYHGPMGHAFWSVLQHNFAHRFSKVGGEFALQIGPPYAGLLAGLPVRNKILIDDQVQRTSNEYQVVADVNALPLQHNSVDVIVLAHALECATHKIDLLKTCYAALVPEGILINVSFNPYSFYSLRRMLGSKCGLPARLHLHSAQNIQGWLQGLGFAERQDFNCGFAWPSASKFINQKLIWMEKVGQFLYPGCGHYIISSARKCVAQHISAPAWQQQVAYSTGSADAASRSVINERNNS